MGQRKIPTLIIWGRAGASVPLQCAEGMQRLITKSRLELLDDAGHLANFDRADEINELVINFLND